MKKKTVFKILRIFIVLVVIAAIGTGALYYFNQRRLMALQASIPTYQTASAQRGDIAVSVTGTGSVSPQETVDVVIDWTGKVQKVNYKKGDIVSQGDIIGVVVNESIQSDIEAANNSLRQQEIALEKQKSNLTKSVTAPETGRIKMLQARIGEDLSTTSSAFGQVCWISPDSLMTMTFTAPYSDYLKDGELEVMDKDGLRFRATITHVNDKQLTIDIHDDLILDPGDFVTVHEIGMGDSIGEGTVSIKNGLKVTGSGNVVEILVTENQMVARGDELFKLDTSDAELSFESQTISVTDAQRRISDLKKDVGKSDVPAPIAGVLSTLNIKESTNCSSGTTVATIQSIDRLETIVNIDELDIAKVEVGQPAQITLEALSGRIYTGTVTKISVIGENSNGFASYPVTIAIDDPKDIKIGMSCEVTIQVSSAKNVVTLPVEALSQDAEGYYVTTITSYTPSPEDAQERPVLSGILSRQGGTARLNRNEDEETPPVAAPNGEGLEALSQMRFVSANEVTTQITRVEVGLINENSAQILNGIKQGDIVVVSFGTDAGLSSMMNMMMRGNTGGSVRSSEVTVIQGGPSGRGQ